MPRHIYTTGGGGCISAMSKCRKTKNKVDLGLKRRIFMSKTHMSLCFYVFRIAIVFIRGCPLESTSPEHLSKDKRTRYLV
jgi:hypothetical protein